MQPKSHWSSGPLGKNSNHQRCRATDVAANKVHKLKVTKKALLSAVVSKYCTKMFLMKWIFS